MGKNYPQVLAQIVVDKIRDIGILDFNRYVTGLAGELQRIEDVGVYGRAGKSGHIQKSDRRYRARFSLRVIDYPTVGRLEAFFKEHEGEFIGDCNFGIHPVSSDEPRLRLFSIEEHKGKYADQRRALIEDLRTLERLFDSYGQNQR